ncbi:hypothetical protein WHI96_14535 [Pseudonocardia tropica]|uniref:Uncharacterized protein n=1 Tax=Pseudonocardia tropica TaxID=681289 RepID=A0ABV1JYS5_9PSEU
MKPLTEQQRQLAHSAAAADGDEPLPEEAEDGTPLRPGQVTMVLENLRDPDGPIVGVPIVNRCHTSPAYGGYTTRFYNVQAPFVVMVERPPRGSDYCDSVGLDGEFAHGTRVTVYDETGEVLERWQTTRAPDSVTRPSVTARFW